eukprot:9475035-Pyramimonas_sp.AAC.1
MDQLVARFEPLMPGFCGALSEFAVLKCDAAVAHVVETAKLLKSKAGGAGAEALWYASFNEKAVGADILTHFQGSLGKVDTKELDRLLQKCDKDAWARRGMRRMRVGGG